MEGVLLQATIYLTAMVIAVPLSVRLGLGSVLGYLIAGIAIGPILGLVGSETQDLQHYAEFGVVLMLFLIGLELDPKTLWNMRKKLIGVGGAQVLLSTSPSRRPPMRWRCRWARRSRSASRWRCRPRRSC
jgi:CPA2 family monovalent cation:H+ antiporter-2